MKHTLLNNLLIFFALILTLASILTGSYISDNEIINIGDISPKRYVAQKDIVDTVETNRLKEEAMATIGQLYKHDKQVGDDTILAVDEFFSSIDTVVDKNIEIQEIIDGQTPEERIEDPQELIEYNSLNLPVALSDKQYETYADMSKTGKDSFKNNVKDTINSVIEKGVTEESLPKTLEDTQVKFFEFHWNDDLKNMGYDIIESAIKPNLVVDNDAINAAKELKANEVLDVIIRKNQKIVDEGEVITEKIFDILISLSLINQNNTTSIVPIIGIILTVMVLFSIAYLYLFYQQRRHINRQNEMLLLFVVYCMTILIIHTTSTFNNFIFIPVYIFPMIVSLTISVRVATMFNVLVVIIAYFICNANVDFLIYFLSLGTIAAILMGNVKTRKKVYIIGFIIGILSAILYFAIALFIEKSYETEILIQSLYAAIFGLIIVIIAVGSLPFWENTFEVDTFFRFLELTNPDNPLLRKLMIEAPGTYHHSLMVANLAETAAYDINADPILTRVGAYFHDIGKLKYPSFFTENQSGVNMHDGMEPNESVDVIKSHITYGLELAEKYKLPKAVKDILVEHHGNTVIKYFYHKAYKIDESVNEDDFRYKGTPPRSKESAVVMLADTVEAAVRSNIQNGKNIDEVESIIDTLIKDKLNDGQLNYSYLKINDLEIIKKSFLKVFQGMYHKRIAYPKPIEKKEEKIDEKIDEKNEEKNPA